MAVSVSLFFFALAGCQQGPSAPGQTPGGAAIINAQSGSTIQVIVPPAGMAMASTSEAAAAAAAATQPSAQRTFTLRPAPKYSKFQSRQAGFSPQDRARIDRNCPFGMPKVDHSFPHGPSRFVVRDGYVLEHSTVDRIPLWVAEHVGRPQLSGHLERSDHFLPDPKLPKGERSELKDYARSGYDRGHQAPAGDETVDPQRKDETFFLSNMAPQAPELNQQIWAELEDLCRKWITEKYPEGFIITGGFVFDPKEETDDADGTISVEHIGPDAVTVPTHFYKIFLAKDGSGKWHAIGFVIPNEGQRKPHHFADFVKSIDWIQAHTGIVFLPSIDPAEAQRLERQPTPISEIGEAP
jgi:endonuclease G, mitochondrial